MSKISPLQQARAAYAPKLPAALQNGAAVCVQEGGATTAVADVEKIQALFKSTFGSPVLTFAPGCGEKKAAINVGVILSGGQAPGGHNVIAGLFDGIKSLNADSRLFGFLKGPDGLVKGEYMELTADIIDAYRNTGGFDMIGSGRTKLETEEQFEAAKANCEKVGITALVIIGGDDSNTNACVLAEYFKSNNVGIQVIGCPKTIDGDLKNEWIEASFGFDTACRVYSELIGNIGRDANSAKKYWHFIKLMGRSASHIALECALQTQPNAAIISEEVAEKKMTLGQIVDDLAAIVAGRAALGMNFGVALIPEGLVEFIPEIKVLIAELNDLLAANAEAVEAMDKNEKVAFAAGKLSASSAAVFASLPAGIQMQLCNDRDPHGNVQVSLIETEKMLAEMVGTKLKAMKAEGTFKGKFATQTHFFGYEGRCAAPSNYDADYCYSLGYNAAALIGAGRTGYMSSVRNTIKPAAEWIAGGIPITMMLNMERRHGADKPVIRKALVELDGAPFAEFAAKRDEWAKETSFVYPGPIQYFGPSCVCDLVTKTLTLEKGGNI
ncbi:MAG: diphosphate--fructose-6-phosphate 1-phosphotransferase [Lentisphaerae bacterium]|nr:diphosphate--fructose-6-phosphate 1-phosphotransferase [Lentisphaerota bacterium]